MCGSGRSGTTLVQRLLDGHPALAVIPGETHCYRRLFLDRALTRRLVMAAEVLGVEWPRRVSTWAPLRRLTWHGHPELERLLRDWIGWFDEPPVACLERVPDIVRGFGPPHCRRAFLALLECVTGEPVAGRRYWVEKTPGNERFVFLDEHIFEGTARWVHVVRSPTSVVASRVLQFGVSGRDRARTIVAEVYGWARAVAQARENRARCGARYLVLRYEDLVTDPSRVMEDVAGFLGLAMHPALLTPTEMGRGRAINSFYPDLVGAEEGIVRSQVARSGEVLTSMERAFIEGRLGPQMAALGYEPDRSGSRPMPTHGLGARAHLELARVRALQRRFRGATLPLAGGTGSPGPRAALPGRGGTP